ncbi:MAG: T9SS type A sorting domain-containing protein [Bacteroidetes bacterium]|nr:MAG: T9SS type A sorting domain-containing protein [Bacteroidota bacterium]UCE69207.1 MAG: T9SS type A sorting domain-containing protein [Flavobacteriaceae bacterium]
MKQLILLICFMGLFVVSAQEKPLDNATERVEFKLNPNPVYDGVVYIESNLNGPKTVRIYDLFGKTVLEKRIDSEKLHLGSLVPGVYMLQLSQKGQLATKKLVVR